MLDRRGRHLELLWRHTPRALLKVYTSNSSIRARGMYLELFKRYALDGRGMHLEPLPSVGPGSFWERRGMHLELFHPWQRGILVMAA